MIHNLMIAWSTIATLAAVSFVVGFIRLYFGRPSPKEIHAHESVISVLWDLTACSAIALVILIMCRQ